MMLVGPMKKKVVVTSVISFLVPVIILGVIGAILITKYNDQIAELKIQSAVVDRYVLKEDVPFNHIITAEDLKLIGVKEVSAPSDSYKAVDKEKLIGRKLKIYAKANSILSESMFYEEDTEPTMDLRLQEFNMILLPSDLVENDYIDVRLLFPTGEDYSVLIGKRVERYSNNTIFLRLTEDEILTVGSAIIEAYILDGAKLYANKYVDPSTQLFEYTQVDYVARYNDAVRQLLEEKTNARVEELRLALLAQNPGATEEELEALRGQVSFSVSDLAKEDIVRLVGLSKEEVDDIEAALAENDTEVLNIYRHKNVTTKKHLAKTYPVKEGVLRLIQSNPNILQEVKNNFNTDEILAQRLEMLDTSINEINGNADKIKEDLEVEIQTQKEERVAYLKALLNANNANANAK